MKYVVLILNRVSTMQIFYCQLFLLLLLFYFLSIVCLSPINANTQAYILIIDSLLVLIHATIIKYLSHAEIFGSA